MLSPAKRIVGRSIYQKYNDTNNLQLPLQYTHQAPGTILAHVGKNITHLTSLNPENNQ
jgi:hypothetical protein